MKNEIITLRLCFFLLVLTVCPSIFTEDNVPSNDFERINKLEVRYVAYNGGYYLANNDIDNKILYLWKDVKLSYEDVDIISPDRTKGGPYNSNTLIIVDYLENVNIKEIVPPVYYLISDNKYEIGYYNHSLKAFYKWKGVEFTKNDIPEKFKKRRIKENRKDVIIIDIPIPPHFWEFLFSKPTEVEDVLVKKPDQE